MKEGDVLLLNAEGINDLGFGVFNHAGTKVFAYGVLPGEQAELEISAVHPTYCEAKLRKILLPSPYRIISPCVHESCGGCQFSCMSYPAQLAFKRSRVSRAFYSAGLSLPFDVPVCAGMDSARGYRNRSIYYVRSIDGCPRAGMFASKSHTLIPIDACMMDADWVSSFNRQILSWAEECGVAPYSDGNNSGILRAVICRTGYLTGQRMGVLVVTSADFPGKDRLPVLASEEGIDSLYLNINGAVGNAVFGAGFELVYGVPEITTSLCGLDFFLGPRSFWQLNSSQFEKLCYRIRDYAELSGGETVFDLYCGAGAIGLLLAAACSKVYGIEIIDEAVTLARRNALQNGIENAFFFTGKSESVCQKLLAEGIRPDLVVVDPPRKGCDRDLLRSIAVAEPSRIVYVSCCPETLARDLKYLSSEYGYRVEKLELFDFFPGTSHVETVVLLSMEN